MPHKRAGSHGSLRTGKDASMEGQPAQSGPNRGTNTGSASPGGVAGSAKAGAAQRGANDASGGNRNGPLTIPGAGKGATTISGTRVGGRAQKGG